MPLAVTYFLSVEHNFSDIIYTVVSREAWATLPESSSRPLPATLAQSRNLAHASLEKAVETGFSYLVVMDEGGKKGPGILILWNYLVR